MGKLGGECWGIPRVEGNRGLQERWGEPKLGYRIEQEGLEQAGWVQAPSSPSHIPIIIVCCVTLMSPSHWGARARALRPAPNTLPMPQGGCGEQAPGDGEKWLDAIGEWI